MNKLTRKEFFEEAAQEQEETVSISDDEAASAARGGFGDMYVKGPKKTKPDPREYSKQSY